MKGPGADLSLHGPGHLQHTGDTGNGDGMAEVGLDRAHGNIAQAFINLRSAVDFDDVANKGSGCMAFEQRNIRRRDPGNLVGLLHGADLCRFEGHEQSLPLTVIGQTNPADNPVDVIPGGDGVFQSFEGDDAGALGGNQAVCFPVKGPAPATATEGLQHGEADVDDQIVCAVHPPRQHHVGPAILQLVAGQFDGIQGRSAGGIQGEGAGFQVECSGDDMGR